MNERKLLKNIKLGQLRPVYSPRTQYNIIRTNDENLLTDLTLNFDPFTISLLKNEFRTRGGELNITEFIMIIKDQLLNWQVDIPNREEKLMRCLTLLFNEIDLNGNEMMDWHEFTNYIIEKASLLNMIKSKNDEVKSYSRKQFRVIKKLVQPIGKVIYIKEIDKIAFYEEGSDEIFFANPDTGQIAGKPLKVEVRLELKKGDEKNPPIYNANTAMILDMLYVENPRAGLLFVSSNDKVIRMFRYSSNGWVPADSSEHREDEIQYDAAQIRISWDYAHEILYSGERYGTINVWDQKSEPQFRQLGVKPEKKQKDGTLGSPTRANRTDTKLPVIGVDKRDNIGHTDSVMDMLPLPKLQFLATCSLDRRVILWDTIENVKRREYKGYHKKGVLCLDFNESLILLVSGGFDHEIFLWNPYISAPVHSLQGHTCPIVGLKFIDNPLHIISVDLNSNIKVWDIKKFKCIDNFAIESNEDKKKFNVNSVAVIKDPIRVVVAGKSVVMYDYNRNSMPVSADENISVCAKFVPMSLSFMTPVGSKVKVWNVLTGDVKKIFSDLTPSEITCFNLDDLARRYMAGDFDGNLVVGNALNGAKLKNLSKHSGEIKQIIPVSELGYIITSGIDNLIKIHDDKKLTDSELIRVITIKDHILNTISFEPSKKHLMTGYQDGAIAFWEIITAKNVGVISEQGKEEVLCIEPLTGINCIVFSNTAGRIVFVVTPPIQLKYTKGLSYHNVDPETQATSCVSSMTFSLQKKKLFVADEKTYIRCYAIDEIVDSLTSLTEQFKERRVYQTLHFSPSQMKLEWAVKAHNDMLRSMEYIEEENLIITTAVDRRVKIFSSTDGKYLESLLQRSDLTEPKPICYCRTGTLHLFDRTGTQRIDKEFKGSLRVIDGSSNGQKVQENQSNEEQLDFNFKIAGKKKKLSAAEEFDPECYFNMCHPGTVEELRSSPWKLNVQFSKYYAAFEQRMTRIKGQIKAKETSILEETKRSRELKYANFTNDEDFKMKSKVEEIQEQKLKAREAKLKGANTNEDEEQKEREARIAEQKKQYEQEAAEQERLREQVKKEAHQDQFKPVLNEKSKNAQSKITSALHTKELKARVLEEQEFRVKLSVDGKLHSDDIHQLHEGYAHPKKEIMR